MKKGIFLLGFVFLFSISLASAETCDLEISLLNQDPYPAVPGEYVKLVFQIEGIESPDCKDITFELLEDYPIVFDPWEQREYLFKKVNYVNDYQSTILVPYEVRIDEDALDGTNKVEVKVQSKGDGVISKKFDVEVADTVAKFETHIQNYDYDTREMTVQVLNIGETDIEALTIQIQKQDNVAIKGSNRIVVGDLDSNEYTTADFEAIPQDGDIEVELIYSDSINVRRRTTQTVEFDSSYFTDRIADQKTTGVGTYIGYAVVAIVVIWYVRKKFFKKKKK